MAHTHSNTETAAEKNMVITIILNIVITVAEFAGGFFSGSLALISDALHNLSDAAAITIAYVAIRLSRKPRTVKYTFGWKRAEIVAAIINVSTLVIVSFFLIRESVERLSHPTPVAGGVMLVVAFIGLAANVVGMLLMKKDSHGNLNVRAAYFHLLSDTVSSAAVIIAAVFILFFHVAWIDPVATILILLFLLKGTWEIIRETVDVVMMSSPASIDLNAIKVSVESLPEILNIHHVHVWKLNHAITHFEAHIEVGEMSVREATDLQRRVEHLLHEQYGIHHTTLQFECDKCAVKTII